MENQLNQETATIFDEIADNVFVYKLFSNPTLLETLKQTENVEVFTTLEPFFVDEIKVCVFYH